MSDIQLEFSPLKSRAAGLSESPQLARITIDRAARSNALNATMLAQFHDRVEQAVSHPDLRALVVTGAGDRAFVGGADINTMATLDEHSAREFISAVHRCCRALRHCPVPVIARINGAVFGAGLELAGSADLRVASDHCLFGMPEVRLGIPSVIEAAVLPGLIGRARTRELLLLGDNIDAATALQWGLVNRVVSADRLDDGVEQMLASLLQNGPQAVRDQKALMHQWQGLALEQAVEVGIDAFAAAWRSDEPTRMLQAWQQRRKG